MLVQIVFEHLPVFVPVHSMVQLFMAIKARTRQILWDSQTAVSSSDVVCNRETGSSLAEDTFIPVSFLHDCTAERGNITCLGPSAYHFFASDQQTPTV